MGPFEVWVSSPHRLCGDRLEIFHLLVVHLTHVELCFDFKVGCQQT